MTNITLFYFVLGTEMNKLKLGENQEENKCSIENGTTNKKETSKEISPKSNEQIVTQCESPEFLSADENSTGGSTPVISESGRFELRPGIFFPRDQPLDLTMVKPTKSSDKEASIKEASANDNKTNTFSFTKSESNSLDAYLKDAEKLYSYHSDDYRTVYIKKKFIPILISFLLKNPEYKDSREILDNLEFNNILMKCICLLNKEQFAKLRESREIVIMRFSLLSNDSNFEDSDAFRFVIWCTDILFFVQLMRQQEEAESKDKSSSSNWKKKLSDNSVVCNQPRASNSKVRKIN